MSALALWFRRGWWLPSSAGLACLALGLSLGMHLFLAVQIALFFVLLTLPVSYSKWSLVDLALRMAVAWLVFGQIAWLAGTAIALGWPT